MRRPGPGSARGARRAAVGRGGWAGRVVMFGAVALAACSAPGNREVTPGTRDRERPAVDLRLAGEGRVLDANTPVEVARTEEDEATWTLERCVRQALEANRSLLDADAGVATAEYSFVAADSAFQLQILPNLATTVGDEGDDTASLDVGLQKLFRTGTVVEFVPSVRKVGDVYDSGYTASITQPLLRGRQREFVESAVDRARYGMRAAARSQYLVEVDVVISTIQAVYRVVQERESLRLIQESAVRADAHLTAATARQRAGLSTSLDVFRAQQQLGRIRDQRDTALRSFADAQDALRVLLAVPLDTPLEIDAPLGVGDEEISIEQGVMIALGRRVELRQAEDDVTEARRLTRVAEIDTQPDLDLILSVAQFGDSDSFGDSFELGSPQFGVSLASNTDVRRLAEKAAYEQAKIRASVTSRAYLLQRDLVIQDVKRALRAVERGRRSIVVQTGQIEKAEGLLIVARKKFELGLATNFNVIEAEDDLREAETALIRSVAATVASQYGLRAALGTLVEIPEELQ